MGQSVSLTGSTDGKELPPLDRIIRQTQGNNTTIHEIQKAVENTIAYLEGHPPPEPASAETEKSALEGAMNQLRFEVDAQSEYLMKLKATVATLGGTV